MLNRIPLSCYPDEETYLSSIAYYKRTFDSYRSLGAERVVRGIINVLYAEDFDKEGMDKLVMLIAGMFWTIEHNGLPDDDPQDLAYNTWYAICDFATGNYDDLFTPEDLPLIKKDVQDLFDYFEKHPALKGD